MRKDGVYDVYTQTFYTLIRGYRIYEGNNNKSNPSEKISKKKNYFH